MNFTLVKKSNNKKIFKGQVLIYHMYGEFCYTIINITNKNITLQGRSVVCDEILTWTQPVIEIKQAIDNGLITISKF